MDNSFELPVLYKGKELVYPAEVIRYGYVHQIKIDIEGQIIILEKDEEGNYRAIAGATNTKELDKDLIQAIVSSLEAIIK